MIDICASDFIEMFVPSQATVGVVGHGYVGQAVDYFFKEMCRVLVHDKAKPELNTLDEVVAEAELIFVCVPTPMRNDGSCHTGIIEDVLDHVVESANRQQRSLSSFVVVVKSTVYPGFTDGQKQKYPGLRLVFSPEFLTEKNSLQDFLTTNRVIVGGDVDDGRVVFKYFEGRVPERVAQELITIVACDPKVAEMVKLFTNGILMTKVLFCNEIYKICQLMGIEYQEVQTLSLFDKRVGISHTFVPGHDGQLGAGGSCFPKDINNLRHIAKQVGSGERLFTAVIERNDEIREEKDWKAMKDRAVIDE